MEVTRFDEASITARMQEQKYLVPDVDWHPRDDGRGWERVCALGIGAKIIPDQVVLFAYPGEGELRAKCFYNIAGTSTQAARLDMGKYNRGTYGMPDHVNKGARPAGIPLRVRSPHAHLWDDNRHLFGKRDKRHWPPFAREVPQESLGWEKCVLWFLSCCNITWTDGFQGGLPPADRLL